MTALGCIMVEGMLHRPDVGEQHAGRGAPSGVLSYTARTRTQRGAQGIVNAHWLRDAKSKLALLAAR